MRVDSVEIKSHLYRLRMIRKQYPHDFQPEKFEYINGNGKVWRVQENSSGDGCA